jgi:hypothetical protein
MAWTLVRHVAQQLSPQRPIMFLAELGRCPRATAKSWASGHRRPPIWVLELARDEITRIGGLFGLKQELDYNIRLRTDEPRQRTGFWIIDPITGQNKANRLGRLERATSGPSGQ